MPSKDFEPVKALPRFLSAQELKGRKLRSTHMSSTNINPLTPLKYRVSNPSVHMASQPKRKVRVQTRGPSENHSQICPSKYQYHCAGYLRHMLLQPYWEYGTNIASLLGVSKNQGHLIDTKCQDPSHKDPKMRPPPIYTNSHFGKCRLQQSWAGS